MKFKIFERSRSTKNKNKIKIITLNIVGLPIKNPLEVDLETLDFNIKLKPNFAWSSILYPYPGTEIGELATNHGYFDANFEKVNVSNKSKSLDKSRKNTENFCFSIDCCVIYGFSVIFNDCS